MNLIDVWIGLKEVGISLFGEKMHFGIRKLSFQAPDNGRRQNNVANGTKTYDQEFCLQNKNPEGYKSSGFKYNQFIATAG